MKYKLTGVKKWYKVSSGEQAMVEQIKAMMDIPSKNVKEGDLGGWVANKNSLSQDGTCWISENSVVCGGAKVEDHAWVIEKSSIETGSVIRDGAVVVNSTVTDFSVVDGDARVSESRIGHKSSVMNHVVIDDSALLGVSISKGSIEDSRVTSKNAVLVFNNLATIKNCHLVITDAQPVVTEEVDFEKVMALNITRFCIYESVKMRFVIFERQTHLVIGDINGVNWFTNTVIKGRADEICTFQNVTLLIIDSRIDGMVTLKGWLELLKCTITDMACLLNESKMLMSLKNVKVSEMAVIRHDGTKRSLIENESIGMDTFLTV